MKSRNFNFLEPSGPLQASNGTAFTEGHSAAGRIMSLANCSETVGNRIRDLPACRAVPQTTEPTRAVNKEVRERKHPDRNRDQGPGTGCFEDGDDHQFRRKREEVFSSGRNCRVL